MVTNQTEQLQLSVVHVLFIITFIILLWLFLFLFFIFYFFTDFWTVSFVFPTKNAIMHENPRLRACALLIQGL